MAAATPQTSTLYYWASHVETSPYRAFEEGRPFAGGPLYSNMITKFASESGEGAECVDPVNGPAWSGYMQYWLVRLKDQAYTANCQGGTHTETDFEVRYTIRVLRGDPQEPQAEYGVDYRLFRSSHPTGAFVNELLPLTPVNPGVGPVEYEYTEVISASNLFFGGTRIWWQLREDDLDENLESFWLEVEFELLNQPNVDLVVGTDGNTLPRNRMRTFVYDKNPGNVAPATPSFGFEWDAPEHKLWGDLDSVPTNLLTETFGYSDLIKPPYSWSMQLANPIGLAGGELRLRQLTPPPVSPALQECHTAATTQQSDIGSDYLLYVTDGSGSFPALRDPLDNSLYVIPVAAGTSTITLHVAPTFDGLTEQKVLYLQAEEVLDGSTTVAQFSRHDTIRFIVQAECCDETPVAFQCP